MTRDEQTRDDNARRDEANPVTPANVAHSSDSPHDDTTDDSTDDTTDDTTRSWSREQAARYAGDEERPLGAYLVLTGGYVGVLAAGAAVIARSRRPMPSRPRLDDLALLAVGTHKLSRLLTKDPVTSPLRAPVARFEGAGGPSEVREEVRGTGFRHAAGELMTCPFCVGQWVATIGAFGLVIAPRATRLGLSILAAVAGSDFLHLVYGMAQQRNQ